jgi:hypothetical protein
MRDAVLLLMGIILFLIGSVGIYYFIKLLKAKIGTEKLRQIEAELLDKESLASRTVLFIQQVFSDLADEEKFDIALEGLANRLDEYGFDYSPEELKTLIESVLFELKTEFGEQWKKQVSGTS